MNNDFIEIEGANVHNLKNINLKIPRYKLVIITGVSGSGKSSLVFNTIFAEGQRRYIESFSSYARNFLANIERPEVDKISGLSPVISIEQKSVNKNPRSTVGTLTEIYDFFRLLFAKVSDAYSPVTGKKMTSFSQEEILNNIITKFKNKKIIILSPIIRGRKGHYRDLFEKLLKKGFIKARIDGEIIELEQGLKLDRYKIHDIELLIDKILVKNNNNRINNAVKIALKHGNGNLIVFDVEENKDYFFSKNLVCNESGISFDMPAPNLFSFNSPYGACQNCRGIGYVLEFDINKIIPNKSLSVNQGAILPLGKKKDNWNFAIINALSKKYNINLDIPIHKLTDEELHIILYGINEPVLVTFSSVLGEKTYNINYNGIINILAEKHNSYFLGINNFDKDEFKHFVICKICNGTRLKKEALNFKIDGYNIAEISNFDIFKLFKWVNSLETKLNNNKLKIAKPIIYEIKKRLKFLLNVGLDYLTLNRPVKSLSGGESQRIRLASQIGSELIDVLYLLDEPSIGLHPRDNSRLINSLKTLRDKGNSIIVVEHDKEIMLKSDYLIDLGPGAGKNGGYVVNTGKVEEFIKNDSLTAKYLRNEKKINIPKKRRKGKNEYIIIEGASGHNLKNINIKIQLGKFICVTGVSGSGKSSLILETLYNYLSKKLHNSSKKPLPYKNIILNCNVKKVISVDQSPIGKTPRSNPATYTKLFDEIRKLFAFLPESKIRGYKASRFSFNVAGGRCEKCSGTGMTVIEMPKALGIPDVYVKCNRCYGKRYNRETLEIRFKGKSINDVLEMTIKDALKFFDSIPKIKSKLKTLNDVGLGYLQLGQASTTLSGGESQRVKLAAELSKKNNGKTIYILDEPTTGLHFHDIKLLLNVLNKLVDNGNTVIVIEHNMDIIKSADWIIDLGPEGGENGGEIVVEGTPEDIIKCKKSFTAKYLLNEFNSEKINCSLIT